MHYRESDLIDTPKQKTLADEFIEQAHDFHYSNKTEFMKENMEMSRKACRKLFRHLIHSVKIALEEHEQNIARNAAGLNKKIAGSTCTDWLDVEIRLTKEQSNLQLGHRVAQALFADIQKELEDTCLVEMRAYANDTDHYSGWFRKWYRAAIRLTATQKTVDQVL